jgi:hypothetical protein
MKRPLNCPQWCEGQHAAEFPVHVGETGEVELAGGQVLTVSLYKNRDEPVQVWLMSHSENSTEVQSFELTAAHGLYDLLGDALVQAGVQL